MSSNGLSGSFQGRTSPSTCSVSRTDGSSNAGVTTTAAPLAGISAAVVRSERCQRIPVKYSSVDPDSTSSAPIFCCVISACSFAIRPRRSSAEIGCAAPVRDFRSVADGVDAARAPSAAIQAAAHPPPIKPRLDTMDFLLGFLANLGNQFFEEAQFGAAGHQLPADENSRGAVEFQCVRLGIVACEERGDLLGMRRQILLQLFRVDPRASQDGFYLIV